MKIKFRWPIEVIREPKLETKLIRLEDTLLPVYVSNALIRQGFKYLNECTGREQRRIRGIGHTAQLWIEAEKERFRLISSTKDS